MDKPIKRKELFQAAAKEGGRLALDLLDGWGDVVSAFRKGARPAPPAGRKPTGWVRPPNSLPEASFLEACTRCDDCVKACPHFVLRKAGPECGPKMLGTPILVPRENPCQLCDGLPCAEACTTGAIMKLLPGVKPRLGTAVVEASRCYMTKGQPCDYCVKACPEVPKAIRADRPGAPAVVDSKACTGCGRCVMICPTEAVSPGAPA